MKKFFYWFHDDVSLHCEDVTLIMMIKLPSSVHELVLAIFRVNARCTFLIRLVLQVVDDEFCIVGFVFIFLKIEMVSTDFNWNIAYQLSSLPSDPTVYMEAALNWNCTKLETLVRLWPVISWLIVLFLFFQTCWFDGKFPTSPNLLFWTIPIISDFF